eukprot:m.20641 g.20641  ORF g.20641 m.20641 type:complete len:347 (-) comp6223_c0_seq1:123-1163(-)
MPKKKAANKKDDVLEADPVLKRFATGYTKRTTGVGKKPLQGVSDAIKQAVAAGTKVQQIVISGEELKDESTGSSRLEVVLVALRETGYRAVRVLLVMNTEVAVQDTLVLAQHLEQQHDLTSLELLDVSLPPFSCRCLGQALTHNKCLTSLTLDFNRFGAEGVRLLTLGMAVNDTLRKLSLRYCCIGPDGGEHLGTVLAVYTLSELFLDGNQLTGEGCAALAKGLCDNGTLSLLSLQDNNIDRFAAEGRDGVAAVRALQSALAVSPLDGLRIDLMDNTLGDDGGNAVLAMHASRKEAGLPPIYVRVDPRMSAAVYASIGKLTKWKGGGGGGKKKKGGKKKGTKKKKK